MTIYKANGDVLYEDVPITKSAIIRNVLMGDNYIEIPFESSFVILGLKRGCYILYEGKKFEIMSKVYPEPLTNKNGYKYTLRFEAQQNHLKRCRVFFGAGESKEVTFQDTTDLASFGALIVSNINNFLGATNWELGNASELPEQTKLIQFNGETCWDALNNIATVFDVEWWTIDNGTKVSLYFGKLEVGEEEEIKKDQVVKNIPARKGDDSTYGTRFFVFGSTKNIPSDYKDSLEGGLTNHISKTRLHLPNGIDYIDAWDGLDEEDVVEQVVFFDDVFPKNTETITAITTIDREIIEGETNKAYVMECANTPFTPDKKMKYEDLGCTFTSGSLKNRSFQLHIDESSAFDKKFEIVAQTESFNDNVLIIPNENLHPEVGDTFVLTGVLLPNERIEEAENELLEKGKSYAKEHSTDTEIYDCPTDPVYCQENNKNFELGQKVLLIGEQFGTLGRKSRIQGYEKKLWNPYEATYTIGDNTAYSILGNIKNEIKETETRSKVELDKVQKIQDKTLNKVQSVVGSEVIRLDSWDNYNPTNNKSVLASQLGYGLKTRLDAYPSKFIALFEFEIKSTEEGETVNDLSIYDESAIRTSIALIDSGATPYARLIDPNANEIGGPNTFEAVGALVPMQVVSWDNDADNLRVRLRFRYNGYDYELYVTGGSDEMFELTRQEISEEVVNVHSADIFYARPSVLRISGKSFDDGLRITHPYLDFADDADIVLMRHRKNRKKNYYSAEQDAYTTVYRKGWSVFGGNLKPELNTGYLFSQGNDNRVEDLLSHLVSHAVQLDTGEGHTDFYTQGGYFRGNNGRKQYIKLGIALRKKNPAFRLAMQSAGYDPDSNTSAYQYWCNGVPRYLFSEVAPITVRIGSMNNSSSYYLGIELDG